MNRRYVLAAALSSLLLQPVLGHAATVSIDVNADAFLAAGSAANPVCTDCSNLNFGAAGTLAVSGAGSLKGQFDSVANWNTTSAVSQFNTAFGAGNWHITDISLNLASNFGDQGEQPNNGIFNTINTGQFNVQWISNNSWIEGTGAGMGGPPGSPPSVTFGNRNTTIFPTGTNTAAVGTFTYTPPGDNVVQTYHLTLNPNLVNSVTGGGLTSLYFTAADDQIGYLFNSKTFGTNHPFFVVSAEVGAVPIPAAVYLFGTGVVGLVGLARRNTFRATT